MARLWFLVVLFVSLVHSLGPHPILPRYVYIKEGRVICLKVGPGCAGPSAGVMHAWYQYDENGNFQWYREDAVLGDLNFVFNREYANPNETWEYFLADSGSTSLQCVNIKTSSTWNRDYASAVYSSLGSAGGRLVYIWNDTVLIHGVPFPRQLYVDVQKEEFFGWSLAQGGGATYYFLDWVAPDTLDPAIFVRPTDLNCVIPPPPPMSWEV